MKRLLSSPYSWILLLVLLVLINWLAALWPMRLDLTAEKRYTLSTPTKKLLGLLEAPAQVDVLLSGEMPAGFRKLANSTNDLLTEFKSYGKTKFQFRFSKPGEGMNDTAKAILYDSLSRLGLHPTNIKAQTKEGEGSEERLVFPGAVIRYKGRTTAIDLLQGVSSTGGLESLNKAEALLEYKFANAIHQLSIDTVPVVGYLAGNGEPLTDQVKDLIEGVLAKNYVARILPIDSVPVIPPVFKALVITKPTSKFSEEQKLKLDQYVMHGGKLLWMVDNLYAEMDSLLRVQNEFIAFDRGLNIEDQLFKYGVRINLDLVQDLNADNNPSVVGTVGGRPQIELLPWLYFPLLTNSNGHPIAKNLDYVLAQFPNSIDTVAAPGIKKTILLHTSSRSRVLPSPAKVSWQRLQTEEDFNTFNKSAIPVAVLLEGNFHSLYSNRVSEEQQAMLNAGGQHFESQSPPNKMIVIADGDIALNAVTQKEGPLPMGMNPYTKYQYANKDFIQNSIEYLVDESGILETRAKDYTLRLLDKKKLEDDKTRWQLINIVAPVLLILVFGYTYQWWRKKKYQFKK